MKVKYKVQDKNSTLDWVTYKQQKHVGHSSGNL